jgi:hypothetical protein
LGHNTARTDILAADQPQPIDPLFVGKMDVVSPFAQFAPEDQPAGLCRFREHSL